jgi:hypothetical protein
MRTNARSIFTPIAAGLLAWSCAAQTDGRDAGTNAPPAPPASAQTATHPDAAVDAVLSELEAADAGLRDLTSVIVYARHDLALESLTTRYGTLEYLSAHDADQPRPSIFSVRFDTFIDDLNRRSEHEQLWVFDGSWLVEQDFKTKTFIRRQVARDGVDPTRLGEGPLPIPIGQRKADILDRFTVSKAPVTAGLEPPDPEFGLPDVTRNFRDTVQKLNATQLRLVPRVPEEGGFAEIRLWYARAPQQAGEERGRLLPVLARAAKHSRSGEETDIAYVQLAGIKTNTGLTRGDVQVPTPSEAQGWHVEIKPLPPEDDGLGGAPAPSDQAEQAEQSESDAARASADGEAR